MFNKTLLFWFILMPAFFVSRLYHLSIFPIFTDEAIYLRWSQIMWHDATQRFLPLSDGKPPLFMWIGVVSLRFFSDPLVGGRIISVLAGFLAIVGFYILANVLFNRRVAIFATMVYLLAPFSLTYDRFALVESLLLTLEVWMLLLLVVLAKKKRLDVAMTAGIVWGLALLTKPPAFLFAIFVPTTLVLPEWVKKELPKIFGLFLVIGLFALSIFGVLILSPSMRAIFVRSSDYTFSSREVIANGIKYPFFNSKMMMEWLVNYLSWPIFLTGLIGLITGLKAKGRVFVFLAFNFTALFIFQAVGGKVIYPRYLLVLFPFIGLFAAYGFEVIFKILTARSSMSLAILVLALLFIPALNFDKSLIFDWQKTPFVRPDKGQYLSFWSSGQGIYGVSKRAAQESQSSKIYIASEGYFGNPLNGLQVYLDGNDNVDVVALSQPDSEKIKKLAKEYKGKKVYFVVNRSRWEVNDPSLPIELVDFYPKISFDGYQDGLMLFRVKT